MSVSKYTEEQLEVANALKSLDVPQQNIDEIIDMITKKKERAEEPQPEDDSLIRMKLMSETDWRKRAALSALLISKSLDK
jgi:hypothetical protein